MARARCPWCLKEFTLVKGGRMPKHKPAYEHGTRSDGKCSGSEVKATNWDLRPIKTQPTVKKKRVRKKKAART